MSEETEKQPLEVSKMMRVVLDTPDISPEMAVPNLDVLKGLHQHVRSAKTIRTLEAIGDAEEKLRESLDMVDTFLAQKPFAEELAISLSRLRTNSEMDFYSFMLAQQGERANGNSAEQNQQE